VAHMSWEPGQPDRPHQVCITVLPHNVKEVLKGCVRFMVRPGMVAVSVSQLVTSVSRNKLCVNPHFGIEVMETQQKTGGPARREENQS
jgi:hypothetical protein